MMQRLTRVPRAKALLRLRSATGQLFATSNKRNFSVIRTTNGCKGPQQNDTSLHTSHYKPLPDDDTPKALSDDKIMEILYSLITCSSLPKPAVS